MHRLYEPHTDPRPRTAHPYAWFRTGPTCFHSGAAPLKSTCGRLCAQRPGQRCPNFPLYTQIICAWLIQTQGSSKCMWTPLMAPANWFWKEAVGCGMAAVKICTVAIRQKDYTRLQGLFHKSRVIGLGAVCTYDIYIYIISYCWIWNELPPLIHKLNMKLFQSLERSGYCLQSVPILWDEYLRWGTVQKGKAIDLCRLTWGRRTTVNIDYISDSNWNVEPFIC